jgi:hypothetical protein
MCESKFEPWKLIVGNSYPKPIPQYFTCQRMIYRLYWSCFNATEFIGLHSNDVIYGPAISLATVRKHHRRDLNVNEQGADKLQNILKIGIQKITPNIVSINEQSFAFRCVIIWLRRDSKPVESNGSSQKANARFDTNSCFNKGNFCSFTVGFALNNGNVDEISNVQFPRNSLR